MIYINNHLLFSLLLLFGFGIQTSIAWILPSLPSSFPFGRAAVAVKERRHTTILHQDYKSGDSDDDIEYYDDFGGEEIGIPSVESSSFSSLQSQQQSSSSSILQNRLQELVMNEQANQQQISDNWKEGYWNVWGCSLDPYDHVSTSDGDSDSSSSKTIVTCLTLVSSSSSSSDDDDDDQDTALLIVGRSDGSLCWLQMDVSTPPSVSSYDTTTKSLNSRSMVTYFENKLTAKSTSDGGLIVGTELQRSTSDDYEQQEEQELSSTTNDNDDSLPFDILAQISTNPTSSPPSAIIDMVVLNEMKMLWTISQGSSNTVQVYNLAVDDNGNLLPDPAQLTQPPLPLETIHTSRIIGMKIIPTNDNMNNNQIVITVSDNGQVVLWDVTNDNISTIFQGNVLEERTNAVEAGFGGSSDDIILSMDVDEKNLYLGSQSGRIFIFSLTTDESQMTTLPLVKSFVAFTNREPGVSAICAAGPGTLRSGQSIGGSRSPATKSLIAGNILGELKQWELIPTGGGSGLEYWPRMASQRLPNKAHVFETDQVFLTSEEQNDMSSQTIRGLMCIQKVILAATNHDLKFWDPETGKVLYDMKGLDFGLLQGGISPSLVVARDSVLVTNGMDQYGKFSRASCTYNVSYY